MRRPHSRSASHRGAGTRHDWQCVFLERLNRLVMIRALAQPEWSDEDRRLVDHALYSTYQDCLRVGLGPVARAVIATITR